MMGKKATLSGYYIMRGKTNKETLHHDDFYRSDGKVLDLAGQREIQK